MRFVFYADIQNGHQKWQENDFWQKVACAKFEENPQVVA